MNKLVVYIVISQTIIVLDHTVRKVSIPIWMLSSISYVYTSGIYVQTSFLCWQTLRSEFWHICLHLCFTIHCGYIFIRKWKFTRGFFLSCLFLGTVQVRKGHLFTEAKQNIFCRELVLLSSCINLLWSL